MHSESERGVCVRTCPVNLGRDLLGFALGYGKVGDQRPFEDSPVHAVMVKRLSDVPE
jgi:hypothetical protein